MKVLFSGVSGIGARHVRNVRTLNPSADLIAVRAEHNETTQQFKMSLVPDLHAGLSAKPDAAIVALPPALHAKAVNDIVSAGVHLYIEKPVATKSSDVQDVALAASSRGVVTMVGCNLRLTPGFQLIKKMISEDAIGRVVLASLRVGQWLPDWRPSRDYRQTYSAQRSMGGGVLHDLIHEIDISRYLFGEFSDVTARTGNSDLLQMDTENHADIVLVRDDITVNLHLDCLDRAANRSGRISGEMGTIDYDAIADRLDVFDAKTSTWKGHGSDGLFSANDALMESMRHFFDCIRSCCQTSQPLSEGVASLMLAEQARDSAGRFQ